MQTSWPAGHGTQASLVALPASDVVVAPEGDQRGRGRAA
jgi:hypothetical protein